MRTKQRPPTTDEIEAQLDLDDRVIPTPQVLDDQTPIDDLEKSKKRKTKKNQDNLQGFDKRLEAGVEREIRINRNRLATKNPIVISLPNGKVVATCSEMRIEGDCSLEHKKEVLLGSCDIHGSVSVCTNASILIKKAK